MLRIATDDGHEGFGYASATPHMGSTKDTLAAELDLFRPLVVGKDPRNIEAILIELDKTLRGAPQSKAAIDCALHELVARSLGVPLNVLFGGQVRDTLPILRILAIKTPAEMAAAAQKLVDKGYRYLKIKVHGHVEEDVARVAAIRKQVGDDVHLTIDANQSYSTKDAITALNRMAEYRIDLVRAAGACRRLRGACAGHADRAGDGRGRRGGGLAARNLRSRLAARRRRRQPENSQARRPAQHARGRAPVRGRATSSTGSAPRSAAACSRAQALHLACALPGVDYACELGEFDRLLDDPFEGLEVENGVLKLPPGAGSGVRLIAQQTARLAKTA